MKKLLATLVVLMGIFGISQGQHKNPDDEHLVPHADDTYKPLKISLSKDGWQYLRFLTWHQMWITAQEVDDKLHFSQYSKRKPKKKPVDMT